MKIAEAASASGLSAHTIRFYEKSGLIPWVTRGPDGHRDFSQENLAWLVLLASLRETGMQTKTMQRFARLYRDGDKTVADRKQILIEHADYLDRQRDALNACERLLAQKLAKYDEIIGDQA